MLQKAMTATQFSLPQVPPNTVLTDGRRNLYQKTPPQNHHRAPLTARSLVPVYHVVCVNFGGARGRARRSLFAQP
jgi:hypothetical protein